jgi:6-phosphogluconate dehydrogenase (decarboxylating)
MGEMRKNEYRGPWTKTLTTDCTDDTDTDEENIKRIDQSRGVWLMIPSVASV